MEESDPVYLTSDLCHEKNKFILFLSSFIVIVLDQISHSDKKDNNTKKTLELFASERRHVIIVCMVC